MRKLFLFLGSLLLYAMPAWGAQNISTGGTDCTTATNCAVQSVQVDSGSAGFVITGTWSGTLNFEVSADGTNFTAVSAFPPNSSTGVTTTSANGTWRSGVSGMITFRVRASAGFTGTAVVTIQISRATTSAAIPGGSTGPAGPTGPTGATGPGLSGLTPNTVLGATNATTAQSIPGATFDTAGAGGITLAPTTTTNGNLNLIADAGGDNLICGNLNGSPAGTCDAFFVNSFGTSEARSFYAISEGFEAGAGGVIIDTGDTDGFSMDSVGGRSFLTQFVRTDLASPVLVTWGNGSGTPAVTASAPLAIDTTTGNITNQFVQSCGTTTTCSHTALTSPQIVMGSTALVSGTPSTAAVTGISPAFTSASSYVCTVSAQSSATTALLSVANVSGSAFTITGPATVTTVINYICAGN